MAAAVDSCEDLEELCDSDELTERFAKAANHLQTLLPNVNDQTLLILYGYYKQGTEGPCNIPKPGWFNMKGKAKWESWNKLGDLTSIEAKQFYIKEIEALDPSFKFSKENTSKIKEGWVTVSTLQQEEVEINEADKTIIDYVKEGDGKKVAQLLRNKADLNNLDVEGLGLIHWAADRGSTDMLEELIRHGADLNLKDKDGQTALHYAASCGHLECVSYLLEKGSEKFAVDMDGCTPADVATDNHIKEMLI